MNNEALEWKTVEERQKEVAEHFKKARKALKMSRDQLSKQSGIPAPTIRHFEDTGNISLYALTACAVAMGYKSDIQNLFQDTIYLNLNDMIAKDNRNNKKKK